jgi:hypothetical protein
MKFGSVLVQLFIVAVFLFMVFALAVNFRLITLPPHYDPFTPPDLREGPSWFRSLKLKNLDVDPQACLQSIRQTGIANTLMTDSGRGPDCFLEDTLMLERMSVARIKPEQTRCSIAARLYLWERHVVQPAAHRYFGQSVKEITHFGSYSCRTIARSNNMSEHSTANAFDISGLRLANGKLISVLASWKAGDRDSEFLHEVRGGLCDYFNLTLSPDYNPDHADHFHVDMGWVRGCH